MNRPAPWPFDSRQAEFETPRTLAEWCRFYARKIPFRELLAEFISCQAYFAGADLVYIDNGLIERPDPPTLRALEYVARELERDPRLVATLWILRGRGELGTGDVRRQAVTRALLALDRIRTEAAHG